MSRIAAIDISPRRIGIAFSNQECTFASDSFLILRSENFRIRLTELYKEYKPSITYIGLPVHLNGEISEQTRYVKTFVHGMRDVIGKFVYCDERCTTKTVEKFFKEYSNRSVDEIVAVNLLTRQLDLIDQKNHQEIP